MDERLSRLADTQEIRDLLARYVRAVDRNDLDDLRAVYHPDAVDEHGGYTGGVDGLIEYVAGRIGDAPQVMHVLGQCLVEFAGADVAVVETYYVTATTPGDAVRAQFAPDARPVQFSAFGRYVDRVERRDDGVWRIAHRVVVVESTRVVTGEAPAMTGGAPASRTGDDPIHRLRGEAGLG